ncbi:MAG: hypothetical protein F6K47_38250 [Symploca sp. SIO2E6]|nr:hypothetical protein [Symploca sp. SIO2E6]
MQTQEPVKHNNTKEMSLREQLLQEVECLPNELVSEVLNFLLFVKMKLLGQQGTLTSVPESPEQSRKDSELPYHAASGKSLADYQGGWAGDDFEACLQLVRESRSKVNFSKYEPF